MSDRFRPLSMEQLTDWAFTELEAEGSVFGIPRSGFFVPGPPHHTGRFERGRLLDTPYGVAAGPHTQMAQNIVAAWLAGARVIELKTVQTLDQLEVHKPCIDATDEGYNVEWSQELRVHESFDEYLRAWVLVHALHRRLGFPGDRPGVVFDLSVGYDLAGIRRPNVRWYLDAMEDASAHLPAYLAIVARRCPELADLAVPSRLADSVTLSTMHGCPPDEIERITLHLLEDRRLHVQVKCNPTLLGPERVRGIVNDDLGYADVVVPDAAFGHDLRWDDAIPMFRRLRARADALGLSMGLKLSNTLEVENTRTVFDRDPTMYMSGRALHAVTVNLAAALAGELGGDLPLSFAGGADCFNVAPLLACGMRTVTVCSDLLKSGGYLRLRQYADAIDTAFEAVGAIDADDFVRRTAAAHEAPDGARGREAGGGPAGRPGGDPDGLGEADISTADLRACALANLRRYADEVRRDARYAKATFRTDRSKTARPLDLFDCIQAPCLDACPVDQQVPRYMAAVRSGDVAGAVRITRADNPLPAVLGCVCDHLCEETCIRTHLDQPLAIRQVKRYIMDAEAQGAAGAAGADGAVAGAVAGALPSSLAAPDAGGDGAGRVAIIGAGPAGLAAATWLARAGIHATILEEHAAPGGMVGGAIPAYRLPQARIDQDLAVVRDLGVEIRYGVRAGADVTVDGLRAEGFAAVLVAVGAQRPRPLGLDGEDAAGVVDGVTFLRSVREGRPLPVGPRVAVVGAGDTAMDCARSALRVGATEVSLVYRRTIDQMPADREEIHAIREEGVRVVELARPVGLRVADGRLTAVTCVRTAYGGARDASGRKVPRDVPGSESDLPVETLIVAIGQRADLDVFGSMAPALTPSGFVASDPETLETSLPGVYVAGDVASHGPASIVRAAADGKRAAAAITARLGAARDAARPGAATGSSRPGVSGDAALPGAAGGQQLGATEAPDPSTPAPRAGDLDRDERTALLLRRAHRAYRVPIPTSPLDDRAGFSETVLGYTEDEAVREASRCLDCDRMCSLCVGVCPNVALMTYASEPRDVRLPVLAVRGGAPVCLGSVQFVVAQGLQVAVLADLCNECGNCVTACPTAGRPYVDKPRLYLDRADFEAEGSNAFMLLGDGAIDARFDGVTHSLRAVGGRAGTPARLEYTAPGFIAWLDPDTLGLLELEPTDAADGDLLALAPAAVMATLLGGVSGSLPHLPVAADGTRVAEPGLDG